MGAQQHRANNRSCTLDSARAQGESGRRRSLQYQVAKSSSPWLFVLAGWRRRRLEIIECPIMVNRTSCPIENISLHIAHKFLIITLTVGIVLSNCWKTNEYCLSTIVAIPHAIIFGLFHLITVVTIMDIYVGSVTI